mgnify:CR=1 FL=1
MRVVFFEPTDKQKAIRRECRVLYDQGYRLVGDWCSRIPELTLRTWQSWERQEGFLSWWTDFFPEHGTVSEADLRALEFEANKAIMEKVREGDMSAVNMVLKLIGLAQSRESVGKESDMDDWFSGYHQDNGWKPDEIPEA